MILPYVSASQVESYKRCKRIWFQRYVLKQKEPTSAAMDRGKRVHTAVEQYLNTGLQPARDEHGQHLDAEAADIFLGGQDLYDDLMGCMVEHEIRMPTYPGGPDWVGVIDSIYTTETKIILRDTKTSSDIKRYSKSEEELRSNTQLIAYATWALKQWPKYHWIDIGHIYLQTRKPHRGQLVSVVVSREHVEKCWQEELKIVKEMVAVAASGVKDVNLIPPSLDACGMYGGCYFRSQCGLDMPAGRPFANIQGVTMESTDNKPAPSISRFGGLKKFGIPRPVGETVTITSKDVVTVSAAELVSGTPILEVPSDKPVVCFTEVYPSIVPPDAPDRNEVVTIEQLEGEKKKRGRRTKAEMEAAKTPAVPVMQTLQGPLTQMAFKEIDLDLPAPQVVPPEVLPFPIVKNLVLYVDCIPMKGAHKNDYTALEDFLSPIVDRVAADMQIADYRLKEYGEGKARVAAKVKERIGNLPEVLVMTSQAPGFPEAYSVLAPHATSIVRGIR